MKKRLPHCGTLLEVGHDNGDDRRLWLVGAERETELTKARVQALRIFPQVGALVGAVHQLADRGCGRGDHRGRKRGREDVGPANEAQDLELWMVGDAKAADGSDRL